MTTINQLLTLIEMSGMQGSDEIMLRVGETIAPMESCTFQEHKGKTALMFQGGRKQPAQETSAVPAPRGPCPTCKGAGWRDGGGPGYSGICPDCAGNGLNGSALCPHGMPLAENVCGPCSEGKSNTWRCTVCSLLNPADATHCRQCEYSRMVLRDGKQVPRNEHR